MPATTIASSGAPARSDLRIDVFGSWDMLAAISARSASRSALRESRGGAAARRRSSSSAGVADEAEGLLVVSPDLLAVHVELDHLLLGLRRREGQAAADDEDRVGRFEVPPERVLWPERRAE